MLGRGDDNTLRLVSTPGIRIKIIIAAFYARLSCMWEDEGRKRQRSVGSHGSRALAFREGVTGSWQ